MPLRPTRGFRKRFDFHPSFSVTSSVRFPFVPNLCFSLQTLRIITIVKRAKVFIPNEPYFIALQIVNETVVYFGYFLFPSK